MKEIEDLNKISKTYRRLCYYSFIPIYIEVIMVFTDKKSPGILFYDEYGNIGITFYLGLIFTCVIFFAKQSSNIESIINRIELKRNIKKNKKNKKTERTTARFSLRA
jgi:hypothetical protein